MLEGFSLAALLLILLGAAAVITYAGIRMSHLADVIADRTGMGEALVGGVLLGAATSLPGVVVTATAAIEGNPSLAFSNGVGGIAIQTAFLALADILHRKANLEHAAAELANVFQGGLLLLLLSLPIIAFAGPEVTFWSVHPVSALLVVLYVVGLAATKSVREQPMWRPVRTHETEEDEPDDESRKGPATPVLFSIFAVAMAATGVAGWSIAQVASELIGRFDLDSSLVGALLTAGVTSLPECVTTFAAVRRGALQLAVGGIIGGNTFDALFLTVGDLGFREGSLYHALERADLYWLATGIAMTAVLQLGQIYRQKHGPAGIGVESVAILAIYATAIAVQALG